MKINTHWLLHVEAWRESGLSQADYCRQQGLNRKTFSLWTRRDQGNPSMDRGASLEFISVQVSPSAPVASPPVSVMLMLANGVKFELSTAVSPRWLAELLRCLT